MTEPIGTESSETRRCVLCDDGSHDTRLFAVRTLHPGLADYVARRIAPREVDATSAICRVCLAEMRSARALERLEAERGALSELEREVAAKASAHASIAQNLTESFERESTFGQRVADGVARVGGSWPFVIAFLTMLAVWMALNSLVLRRESFDPYPYILLNLVLSCVAALQAPIIMMSQNRSALRDRRQADLDFRVNLKAEIEIAALHEKIDHLLHAQWEDLISLQQTQIELLEELAARRSAEPPQAT